MEWNADIAWHVIQGEKHSHPGETTIELAQRMMWETLEDIFEGPRTRIDYGAFLRLRETINGGSDD